MLNISIWLIFWKGITVSFYEIFLFTHSTKLWACLLLYSLFFILFFFFGPSWSGFAQYYGSVEQFNEIKSTICFKLPVHKLNFTSS